MKRFFQPVKKDGSFKKPALSPADPPVSSFDDSIAIEGAAVVDIGENESREPRKFLTWNANSLLLRMKKNLPEFSNLVQALDPDAIAIQEVRMPAAGSKGASKNPSELKDDTSSSREEKLEIMRVLSSPPFQKYRVWWSLSDSKYGGTALLVKNQCKPKKVSFSLDRNGGVHILSTDETKCHASQWDRPVVQEQVPLACTTATAAEAGPTCSDDVSGSMV